MAKQKVTLTIESSDLNPDKIEKELFFINGKRIEVKKDAEVKVDPLVKDLYKECRANLKKGNTQEKELVLEG